MHKLSAALATLAFAGLAALVPATAAQADTAGTLSAACDTAWRNATSGHFYAYSGDNCSGVIGHTPSWDSDWGNSSGPFTGGDTNVASSILHKGTSGLAVAVYNGTGQDWGGGFTCLRKAEFYASVLSDNTFNNGVGVNNAISSHRWVAESSCRGHFVT